MFWDFLNAIKRILFEKVYQKIEGIISKEYNQYPIKKSFSVIALYY